MTDLEQLAALFLTGPDGESLCISSPLSNDVDGSFRFTVTHAPTGNRWGIVAGITQLTAVKPNSNDGQFIPTQRQRLAGTYEPALQKAGLSLDQEAQK